MSLHLLPRPEDGHKGTFGHAMIVAGQYGMAGASVLAARACLRSGVGKVTVHLPRLNNDIMQMAVPEAIVQHDADEYRFTHAASLAGITAVAIGPGLGTAEVTCDALHAQLVASQGLPLVVDADGLNILSLHPAWLATLPAGSILTPHVGEMRRLLEATSLADAAHLSQRYGVLVVMKGHPTVVYHPDGSAYSCPYGNDGMATAGSGDVLTGIVVALLAQGYPAGGAAELGVTLHALAGDAAAASWGRHSMVASDIIEHLPQAFRQLA